MYLYLQENLREPTQTQNNELHIAIYYLACFYFNMGEPDKALPLHEKAKDYYEKLLRLKYITGSNIFVTFINHVFFT